MSRTDISAASLADYLRRMAGDGSMEWCYEPMQASVLLDMADMLDENAKLRELACILAWCAVGADCDKCPINTLDFSEWPNGREICYSVDDRMRELGLEVDG